MPINLKSAGAVRPPDGFSVQNIPYKSSGWMGARADLFDMKSDLLQNAGPLIVAVWRQSVVGFGYCLSNVSGATFAKISALWNKLFGEHRYASQSRMR